MIALGMAAVVGGAAGRAVLRTAGASVSARRLILLLGATVAAALATGDAPVVQLLYLGVAAAVGYELLDRAVARLSGDGAV